MAAISKEDIVAVLSKLQKKNRQFEKDREKVILKDKDTYFYITGKKQGIRIAMLELYKLINKK